nr:immunoglobulin heavy chain junction region [Mus musculus]
CVRQGSYAMDYW